MALSNQKSKATQEFVPVQEIRDSIVILKDGTMCAILMVSSLNFALKSQDEQESILFQFQNFLNSLDFSTQILIQSRDLDIRPYIALLQERLAAQTEDLMKIQIREYIEFVKNFTESVNIMTKSFFIVVPYTPPILSHKEGMIGSLSEKAGLGQKLRQKSETFEENRTQLQQRLGVVEQGIARTGLRVVQLGTEEEVELFYKMFNPGELEKPMSITQVQ